MRRLSLRAVLLAALLACACEDHGARAPDAGPDSGLPDWVTNATLIDAAPAARVPAGRQDGGAWAVLPGGRAVTPAGELVEVGGFLLGVRVLGGGRHVLTTDGGYRDEYLSVVDTATREIVQRERFASAQGRSLFLGLAVRADGRVYASAGGANRVYVYQYDAGAVTPLAWVGEWPLGAGTYASGLALAGDRRLLVALQMGDALDVRDADDGTRLALVDLGNGNEAYDVVYDPGREEAYVSLWGGDGVAVVDMSASPPALVTVVPVGKNPEALLLAPPAAPERLLVTNSGSDSISIIDLDTRTVVDEVSVAASAQAPRGSFPNHLALDPAGDRLYVANAGENCLDVLSTATYERIGRLPTAWYPTAVVPLADGTLYVAAAKGLGGGPTTGGGFDYGVLRGTLSVIPPPDDATLAAGEAQVEANNHRPAAYAAAPACPAVEPCRFPLPAEPGGPTPIEHVILIVRENKTYDCELGDLGGDADGDPDLVLFGEHYTPNLHALARTFVNADNFYSDSEASIQGHQWTTAGTTTDFTEKAWLTTWGRGTHDVIDFARDISAPEQGYYFQHLSRAGVSYMSFGEAVGLAGRGPGDPPVESDLSWPGGILFNLDVRDVDRAIYFGEKLASTHWQLPRFTYMLLPDNHTQGLSPGKWTPEFMVADNDEATGRIVDLVSHSRYWPTTIIFIIEDDPNDGADHVEAHRSALVVASPWVKRGMTTHVNYDVPSLWRTIELLVGLTPRTRFTADAAPMYDIFAAEPDTTPYRYVPKKIDEAFNPNSSHSLVERSRRMDFSTVDNAPGLGRLLWEHRKGEPAPWATMPLPVDVDDDGD